MIKVIRENELVDSMLSLLYYDAKQMGMIRQLIFEIMNCSSALYIGILDNFDTVMKLVKRDKNKVIY